MAVVASLLYGCAQSMTVKEKTLSEKQEEEIYAHMQRYGINRDDVAALKRLYEGPSSRPFDPRIKLPSAKFYKPGEHYRIEMDEYILTMKVPAGDPDTNWIWPYNNIRDPDLKKELERAAPQGSLMVADLGWYTRPFPGTIEDRNSKGVSISYRLLKPEEEERYSTPDKMLAFLTEWQKGQIKTPADVEQEARRNPVSIWVPTWLVLKPERVVVNGRIWIRDGMSDTSGRPNYFYRTTLKPGRYLVARFSLPKYNYPPNADPRTAVSTYPEPIREAITRMGEMVASLRIAKLNDDGAPDPFVLERVEPAPLPLREKLPAAH
ncbi:MAG: hypothetical protein LBE33_08355 [Zoogloeaceae bacterium]|jgi:hypothetical protein|nr:hypothetical protein [Zoogloeaceae bacterium]